MARVLALAMVLLPTVWQPGAAAEAPGPALAVIVHPSRSDTPGLLDLRRIYLRNRRLWADGAPIVPINLEPHTPEREGFSQRVLGGPPARFADYWNKRYFDGVLPPLVLPSPAAVVRFVAQNPHAIGYVSLPDVDTSVRTVYILAPAAAAAGP